MDIRIEKKKGIRALFTKKGIPYLAGALFLVFVLWLLLRDNSSTLRRCPYDFRRAGRER